MERHQYIALLIFCAAVLVIWITAGRDEALRDSAALFLSLLLILLYRLIARLAGIGFPETLAKDYGGPNHPGPYAVVFWILFLVACVFCVFDLSVY